MPVLDDIGQEKQRIAERLARLDAERAKLAEQLAELEAAERVLTRLAGPARGQRRRPGGPPRAAAVAETPEPAPPRRRGRARAADARQQPSASDAVLRVVQAHSEGITAADVLKQLTSEGLTIRPNHLGMALQRHLRAGRLVQRDDRWYPPSQPEPEAEIREQP